jgi:hypothetical protein
MGLFTSSLFGNVSDDDDRNSLNLTAEWESDKLGGSTFGGKATGGGRDFNPTEDTYFRHVPSRN